MERTISRESGGSSRNETSVNNRKMPDSSAAHERIQPSEAPYTVAPICPAQVSYLQRTIGNASVARWVASRRAAPSEHKHVRASVRASQPLIQRAMIDNYAGGTMNDLIRYAKKRVLPVHEDLIRKCQTIELVSAHIATVKADKGNAARESRGTDHNAAKAAMDAWIAALNQLFEQYAAAAGNTEDKQSEHSQLSGDGLTNNALLDKAGNTWNNAWTTAPIPIDFAEVPEVVKTLIKFIDQEDSVVGAEYAHMKKEDVVNKPTIERQNRPDPADERRSNAAIVNDPRALRAMGTPLGNGENRQELAPVLREYEKGHYGLMRSMHIDDKGNLPDIRMNNEVAAFANAKTQNYTRKNVEDFLMKEGAPRVVLNGARDTGVQGGFGDSATDERRALITTNLAAWNNGVPAETRSQENDERRKAANNKNYAKGKQLDRDKSNVNVTLRPQGYTEYNLIGSWRLVYDYVNFKYYITDHYQRWKPTKYLGNECNPFFEIRNVGNAPLSVDGQMEMYRLQYWENRRREGLDTLA